MTVAAGQLYRLLALKLSRYERATPATLWRDFLDATGTLHIDEAGVTCAEPARHPPHPHRRWLRRTRHPHPLVGRPHPPLHPPATLNRAAEAHLNSII
jgi:hypothetical protein